MAVSASARRHRRRRRGPVPAGPGVTWIGAAAFAARHGARLPDGSEMTAETQRADVAVTNSDYQIGDTVPVTESGRGPGEVHHLVGNLQP